MSDLGAAHDAEREAAATVARYLAVLVDSGRVTIPPALQALLNDYLRARSQTDALFLAGSTPRPMTGG